MADEQEWRMGAREYDGRLQRSAVFDATSVGSAGFGRAVEDVEFCGSRRWLASVE